MIYYRDSQCRPGEKESDLRHKRRRRRRRTSQVGGETQWRKKRCEFWNTEALGGSEKRRCTDTPKVTSPECRHTHTCTCVCFHYPKNGNNVWSPQRDSRAQNARSLGSGLGWPTVGDWVRLEAPLAAAKKVPPGTGGPRPRPKWSQRRQRPRERWVSWVGFLSRGFCAFWLLNFAELRPIYDWAGAAECQYEYLRPARAQEWVFLVFRFWRRWILYARISARKRSASGGTGWPPTEFGSEGVKSHASYSQIW